MFETLQTLHAVISRFQMRDPDAVSLKIKVYPFEVPLVFRRFDEATPLNTEVNCVFKIEVFVVDKEEIPNVVFPVAEDAESRP